MIDNKRMIRRRSRSGISVIIGSMFMLLIVVSIGTVLLTVALNNINLFNITLRDEESNIRRYKDLLIIENVALIGENRLTIWLRNIGSESVQVNRITIFSIDDQNIVLQEDTNIVVVQKQLREITYNLRISQGHTYKIIISTTNSASISEYFTL
ncbi:MAG: hypothetical protein ACK4FV_06775 [Candidatus Nitrosocaldus sp.]